ncbi:hypothetical protein ACLOJK_040002 [Asimina triloba]
MARTSISLQLHCPRTNQRSKGDLQLALLLPCRGRNPSTTMEQSAPSIWVSLPSWFTPTVLFVLINVIIIIAFFPSKKTQNRLPRQLSHTASFMDGFKSFNLHRQRTQDPIPPMDAVDDVPAPADGHGSLPRQLSRTSSLMESLRSFSIYRQNTQDKIPTVEADDQHPLESESKLPRQLSRTSSIFESLKSFNTYRQNAHPEAPPVTTVEQQAAIETVETVVHGDFTRSQSETHPGAEERRERVGLKKMKKSASAGPSAERVVKEEEEETSGIRRPSTMREGKAAKEDDEVDARADDFINRFRQQLKLQRLDSLLRYKEFLNRGN